MSAPHEKPIPSKVAIFQHPLHPMAVSFPIAFLTFNFVTDMVYWWSDDVFWGHVSFWLASAGFAMGVLAALLGMSDFFLTKEVRRHIAGWSHFIAAVMVLALAGTNVQLRWDNPVDAVLPWGLFVSANMTLMLAVTGWLGGTLTFRHGIGTYSHEYDDVDRSQEEAGDEAAGPIKE